MEQVMTCYNVPTDKQVMHVLLIYTNYVRVVVIRFVYSVRFQKISFSTPQKVSDNSEGWEWVLKNQNILKENVMLNSNFQRGRVEGFK